MVASTQDNASKNWQWFLVIAGFLILRFGWRVLVTAHEFDSRTSQLLTMAIDAGLIYGLVSLRSTVVAKFTSDDPRKNLGEIIFWIGLFAGIGLFGIRLTSNAAWWTGHLHYSVY